MKAAQKKRGPKPRVWPLALEVPMDRLDDLVRMLSPDDLLVAGILQLEDADKARLLQMVLQARLDGLLNAPSPEVLGDLGRRLIQLHSTIPSSPQEAPRNDR